MLSHANSIQRPFVLDRAVRRSSHGAQNEFDVKNSSRMYKECQIQGIATNAYSYTYRSTRVSMLWQRLTKRWTSGGT